MVLQRKAHQLLLNWKEKKGRKPLLIRGARQVGKTTLVRMFAEEFSTFIELNLERHTDRQVFDNLDSTEDILNAIYLLKDITARDGDTLIFIDEIQESPNAIKQLRYFYEEHPDLYIIAAGSLLEFAMKDVASFPVGRVEYMCIHPLDFEEYLMAFGKQAAIDQLNNIPVADFANDTLLALFHEYAIVGGMPEIVNRFAAQKNIAELAEIYESIWQSYMDDVEKYARNVTDRQIIRHIIASAPSENDRVTFEGFGRSQYRSREVGEAMRSLDLARVIQLIYPTSSVVPPLLADPKKRPRLQLLDTGLLNHALGLQGKMIGLKDLNDLYRGKIIQHLVTQQFIAIHPQPSYKPHFWVREEKGTNSEVDLVFQQGQYIVPVEVKSGGKGRLRSLHQFVERTDHPYAVRLLANHLIMEKARTPGGTDYLLMNLPYYLACKIPEYTNWFIENHKL